MLITILKMLAANNVYNLTDLASKLGVSEVLLKHMLGSLVQKGYLQPVEMPTACSMACNSCPIANRCKTVNQTACQQGWILTKRGLSTVSNTNNEIVK